MHKKRILIIEDDANIRDVMKMALEFDGYSVATAKDGKEGLRELAENPHPDLILLDLMMPIMNGWEFVEAKKSDPTIKAIPVVVVSAYSEKAKIIECKAFVEKPLELETLLKAVKENIL